MADFLTGDKLNVAIIEIIEKAKTEILLASPYIKLHARIKDALKKKIDNPDMHVIVLFGKNENALHKSINQDDFEFLKEFPNIAILHEERLHAKFYGNDDQFILSSMNLYEFSQNNNIEFGVREKRKVFFKNDIDSSTEEFISDILSNADILFERVPEFEKAMLGIASKYKSSKVEIDKLSKLLHNQIQTGSDRKMNQKRAFCIRTRESIPFNVKQPYSDKAFQTWSKFGDDQYPEKYCHFTGEDSDGETCMARPILRKNWKEAMK